MWTLLPIAIAVGTTTRPGKAGRSPSGMRSVKRRRSGTVQNLTAKTVGWKMGAAPGFPGTLGAGCGREPGGGRPVLGPRGAFFGGPLPCAISPTRFGRTVPDPGRWTGPWHPHAPTRGHGAAGAVTAGITVGRRRSRFHSRGSGATGLSRRTVLWGGYQGRLRPSPHPLRGWASLTGAGSQARHHQPGMGRAATSGA